MSVGPGFALQPHLDRLNATPPQLAWDGRQDISAWQHAARQRLLEVLRIADRPTAAVRGSRLRTVPRDGLRHEQWALDGDDGVAINVHFLLPPGPGLFEPVLVFHGHNRDVQTVLGLFRDDDERSRQIARDGNYAESLARSGRAVIAVEQRGFGERRTDGTGQSPDVPYTDRHLAFSYLLHGRTLLGERVRDGLQVLDWLSTREELRLERLSCTGNSGGGTVALLLAALDERVRCAIPACCFSSLSDSLLNPHFAHCECNYIPDLAVWFDMGEIASLVAPRPLCLIGGRHDPIFPIIPAQAQAIRVAAVYAAIGHPEAFHHAVLDMEHRYHFPTALEWLNRWMGDTGKKGTDAYA